LERKKVHVAQQREEKSVHNFGGKTEEKENLVNILVNEKIIFKYSYTVRK
jgi:hypothetical protein